MEETTVSQVERKGLVGPVASTTLHALYGARSGGCWAMAVATCCGRQGGLLSNYKAADSPLTRSPLYSRLVTEPAAFGVQGADRRGEFGGEQGTCGAGERDKR